MGKDLGSLVPMDLGIGIPVNTRYCSELGEPFAIYCETVQDPGRSLMNLYRGQTKFLGAPILTATFILELEISCQAALPSSSRRSR